MFYPFLVSDPRSDLQYRLTDTGLAELSLAPISAEWAPGRAIAEAPDVVWAESLANAPVETISSVTTALMDLVLATPDLKVPDVDHLPDKRAKRHPSALVDLWQRIGGGSDRGSGAHSPRTTMGSRLNALQSGILAPKVGTALHLALAKRPPTLAMVLASRALSPLMPWAAQSGRDLAESLMSGDFRGAILLHTAVFLVLLGMGLLRHANCVNRLRDTRPVARTSNS